MATLPKDAQDLFDNLVPEGLKQHPDKARELNAIYCFKITGEGGGEWTVDLIANPPTCTKGDSGKAVGRCFCPDCGSPILSDVEAMPGIAIIKAGTLDDTNSLKPGMQIFCDSAQPWVQLGGEMKHFARMPG